MSPGWVGSSTVLPEGNTGLGGWQTATDNLFSRANGTLQSALVFGSGGNTPDGDGGGGHRFSDGGIEQHHHHLWQAEFIQLPQEVLPLLTFLVRVLMVSSHLRPG